MGRTNFNSVPPGRKVILRNSPADPASTWQTILCCFVFDRIRTQWELVSMAERWWPNFVDTRKAASSTMSCGPVSRSTSIRYFFNLCCVGQNWVVTRSLWWCFGETWHRTNPRLKFVNGKLEKTTKKPVNLAKKLYFSAFYKFDLFVACKLVSVLASDAFHQSSRRFRSSVAWRWGVHRSAGC